MTHKCFWDIVYPVTDWDNPTWHCMIDGCNKTKQSPIPILDTSDLLDSLTTGESNVQSETKSAGNSSGD